MTEKSEKPAVNFAVLQSVEDYVEKSGKFRTKCASFNIPGRDSGGSNAVYIPYCNKQRFDLGPVLNDWRGHGVFKPPEIGKPWEIPDFVVFRERFHDIHCPQPCRGYRSRRVVGLLNKLRWRGHTAGKWTGKEITTIVVVPAVLCLVGALLGWLTPEGRLLLHLDKPQPEQSSSSSVPQTKPQADSASPQSPDVAKPVSKPSLAQKPEVKAAPKGKAVPEKTVPKNDVTGNITNAPGGIVNNGGTITNPTVINVPPASPANPLDPYDGKPDLKVAEDAIGMGTRFLNSVQSCDKGIREAAQQDIDSKNPDHTMYHLYISQTKYNLRMYSKDLRDLHTSLIYRLGAAERDASADETLDGLLEQPNQFNRYDFYCLEFQEMGDYFTRLGNKLKVRANHP
jgi:hypothetical protein